MNRLLTCCCRGLLRGKDDSKEFYELLGLDKNATEAEIKRAYRTTCLRMHPDKLAQRGQAVTDEDRAKFQRMKHAYDVLSDPEKRELYDQMGEMGVKFMEDPASAMSPDVLAQNFMQMRNRDRLMLVLFVCLIVGGLMLFPILLCVKADGNTDAQWAAIWTPLWIYDAVLLLIYSFYVSLGHIKPPADGEDEQQPPPEEAWPLWQRCLDLLLFALLVLFQVFLTLRLDNNVDWTWAAVFAPWFAWEALRMAKSFVTLCSRLPRVPDPESAAAVAEEEDEVAAAMAYEEQKAKYAMGVMRKLAAIQDLFKDAFWLLQGSFLVVKLDHTVDWSWWAVFSPIWVVFGGIALANLRTYAQGKALHKQANILPGQEPETWTEEQQLKEAMAGELAARFYMNCCCWGMFFIVAVVAVAKIAGASYSVFYVFMPLFIIAGLLLCAMVCCICCIRDMDEEVPGYGSGAGADAAHPGQPSYGTYSPPGDLTTNPDAAKGDGSGSGGAGSAAGAKTPADTPAAASEGRLPGPPRPPSLRGNEGPMAAPLPPGSGVASEGTADTSIEHLD